MNLVAIERDLYVNVWQSVADYGSHAPGEHYAPMFLEMSGATRGRVLDAGCGSGKGALALRARGFSVVMCDLTDAGLVTEAKAIPFSPVCLWRDDLTQMIRLDGDAPWGRTRFDYVYCCDVLEHIPPQFTMLAVDRMLRASRLGVFLAVSLVPDINGAWVGEPLHKTVQPFTWWRDSLQELGAVDARDLQINAAFLVRPR